MFENLALSSLTLSIAEITC